MSSRTQRRAGGAKQTDRTRSRSPERVVSTSTERHLDALRPYEGNARTHSRRQIRQFADRIDRFGFTNPVLIADDDTIIAGHGRVLAARSLGMTEVPTVRLSHMSEAERRAYILADNRLAEEADWGQDLLALVVGDLSDLRIDLAGLGFKTGEIDALLRDGPDPREERGSGRTDLALRGSLDAGITPVASR